MTSLYSGCMNLQIRMRHHPRATVTADDFEISQVPAPLPGNGEVLVKNEWLSLDPYMRLRMSPERSYVDGLSPGDVMPGATVGTIVKSDDPQFPIGTLVSGLSMRWETYSCTKASALSIVSDTNISPSAALGVVGMPGVTAHYGLLTLAQPKAGDTVVVSAAAGAVGSVVGQLAKAEHCRVIGIAGGPTKCRYVVHELGFDACIDYKSPDFEDQLAAATPNRVDIQFENVGGRIMDTVFTRLNSYARIVLCGLISEYDAAQSAGLRHSRELLVNRASLQAFIIREHPEYWPDALRDLANRVRAGTLRYREDVTEGLLNAPSAFIDMLYGRTFGKKIIRITEHDGIGVTK